MEVVDGWEVYSFLGSRRLKIGCRKKVFLPCGDSVFYGEDKCFLLWRLSEFGVRNTFLPPRPRKHSLASLLNETRTFSSVAWAEKFIPSFSGVRTFRHLGSKIAEIFCGSVQKCRCFLALGAARFARPRPSSQKTPAFLYLTAENFCYFSTLVPKKS